VIKEKNTENTERKGEKPRMNTDTFTFKIVKLRNSEIVLPIYPFSYFPIFLFGKKNKKLSVYPQMGCK